MDEEEESSSERRWRRRGGRAATAAMATRAAARRPARTRTGRAATGRRPGRATGRHRHVDVAVAWPAARGPAPAHQARHRRHAAVGNRERAEHTRGTTRFPRRSSHADPGRLRRPGEPPAAAAARRGVHRRGGRSARVARRRRASAPASRRAGAAAASARVAARRRTTAGALRGGRLLPGRAATGRRPGRARAAPAAAAPPPRVLPPMPLQDLVADWRATTRCSPPRACGGGRAVRGAAGGPQRTADAITAEFGGETVLASRTVAAPRGVRARRYAHAARWRRLGEARLGAARAASRKRLSRTFASASRCATGSTAPTPTRWPPRRRLRGRRRAVALRWRGCSRAVASATTSSRRTCSRWARASTRCSRRGAAARRRRRARLRAPPWLLPAAVGAALLGRRAQGLRQRDRGGGRPLPATSRMASTRPRRRRSLARQVRLLPLQ